MSNCHAKLHTIVGDNHQYAPADWLKLVCERGYQGVIFDCDGTLVQSEEAHENSFKIATSEQGFEMNDDWYSARAGLDRKSFCFGLLDVFGTGFHPDLAISRSMVVFQEYIHLVKPIAETGAFVKGLACSGFKLAIGTNCETPLVQASLRQVGLARYFQQIASVSDNLVPKPSPNIFQCAAQMLELHTDQVLVVEDSPQGVQAAMNAKMDVLELAWSRDK